jgi:predicted nucleic acid-binding protein
MSIVVSDTSPLRALNHLGHTELLRTLYGEILIPPAVASELAVPRGKGKPLDVSQFPYITIQAPQNSVQLQTLSLKLDSGEAQAIALAIEVQAEILLIDESDGRAAATLAGLKHVGVLGILTRAKREGLISTIRPQLDRLRNEIQFFIADHLYDHILQSVGE